MSGDIVQDTSHIIIEPARDFDSIEIRPNSLHLWPGYPKHIHVDGYWNGQPIDMTQSNDLQYQILEENVSIEGKRLVHGNEIGCDRITVFYKEQLIGEIPVFITPFGTPPDSTTKEPTPVDEVPRLLWDFELYPNPTSERVNIVFSGEMQFGPTQLIITDLWGRPVMHKIFQSENRAHLELDISPLSKGIYFVQCIKPGNIVKTKKLIVN